MFFDLFRFRECFSRRKKKMSKTVKIIEWKHLPPEIHQMISERCDFTSRTNLQLTSKAMKNIVDSSKLYIPSVKLTEKPDNSLRLNFILQDYWEAPRNYEQSDCGTLVNRKTQIDGKSPVDVALGDFQKFCIRKKVTSIGCVHLETLGKSEELVEKMKALLEENKKTLKIKSIEWDRSGQNSELAWSFLKFSRLDTLNYIKIFGSADSKVELFANTNLSVLSNLSRLEVLAEVDAAPEDVLALNAFKIHLQSENFKPKLMMDMLKKWMVDQKPVDSMLVLKNLKNGNLTANLMDKVPNGFEKVKSFDNQVLRFQLTLENSHFMILRIGPHGISVEIQNSSANPFDNFSQKQREKCLTRAGCCCQVINRNVDFRFLSHYDEMDDLGDFSDSDDSAEGDDDGPDEYNYEFDGGWRSDLDESDLEEYLQFDQDEEY